MKTGTLAITLAITLAASTPAQAAPFKNCSAMNIVHKHGIAKSAAAAAKASGLTGQPTISAKLYAQYKGKDRDRDGVACES